MKNIFKSRFSLIAICIVLGILIGSFALCGCRTNYGLLEGMEMNKVVEKMEMEKKAGKENIVSGQSSNNQLAASGGDGQSTIIPSNVTNPQLVGVGDIAGSLSNLGSQLGGGNAATDALKKAIENINPMAGLVGNVNNGGDGEGTTDGRQEPFQVSRPLAWGPIKDSESEDVNLTKWVSNAMRYSKGMGNENRLDSYQYNSGPPIPLPEGKLFFFEDTKFDSSCCPGTYSNSMGCACLSKKQMQHLTMRGGNNTIPNTKTSYYNEF
jgi:hypothetical protein